MSASIAHEDARKWLAGIEPGTVDLVLTGPPHSTDHWWEDGWVGSWLFDARKTLKDTGAMLIHCGSYPRELAEYLRIGIPKQMLFWDWRNAHEGDDQLAEKGDPFVRACDVILYYPRDGHHLRETMFTVDALTWPIHLRRLVRATTDEGDLVIDPFAGWGGCLLAAEAEGRVAKGCDISMTSIEIAVANGCVLV